MTQTLELPTLAAARETVLPGLRRVADRLSADVRAVIGYRHGWLDERGRGSTAATGKALRPALALLSAQAAGGAATSGIPAAVAVELVHDFSLLHDNVTDTERRHRHRPAARTVLGTPSVIRAGDALLTAALEVLPEHDSGDALAAARSVSATVQRLIARQAADLDFERRDDVTPKEYLSLADGKTAALLSCACSLGALLAGAPPHTTARLGDFGNHLGLAFQLVENILAIWGNESTLRLIEDSGGRQWAEEQAARQLALAERCLDDLPIPTAVRSELLATARFVTERRH